MRAHEPAKAQAASPQAPRSADRPSGRALGAAPLGPGALTPAGFLALQRSVGNAAVPRLLQQLGLAPTDSGGDQGTAHEHEAVGGHRTDAPAPVPPARSPAPVPASAQAPIVQRATETDGTMTFETPAYTTDQGRAGRVSVNNIRGTALGAAANSPTPGTKPIGWDQLYNHGHTLSNPNPNNSHYNAVKMHLMNGRLGGPGNNTNNLAPGPATVNSSMSAGPETAAKQAVNSGHWIWLETAVAYQTNTVNASDFTSVIPNIMTMSWGLMTNASPTDFTRGAAQPPAWSVAINQPAGALTAGQQAAYQALATTAQLDAVLRNPVNGALLVSGQELAQAYALVTPTLQKHMVINYHDIYLGMDETTAAATLMTLTPAEGYALARALVPTGDPSLIAELVLEPLYSAAGQATLQNIFTLFPTADQVALAVRRSGEILPYIGALGVTLAQTNRTVFNLYDDATTDTILGVLTGTQIDNLLNGSHGWYDLISEWCDRSLGGPATADQREAFLQPRLSGRMMSTYDREVLRWQRRDEEPRKRKSARK
ncbi:hypothetical protein [Streptomyces sp. NPDC058751]|uniref:hypothetical protein n=1 Tax=Streptomyces sp. NPDC058751 TaxID=3346623 RepID=UPI0036B6D4CB